MLQQFKRRKRINKFPKPGMRKGVVKKKKKTKHFTREVISKCSDIFLKMN
jgi:hypothetical protein